MIFSLAGIYSLVDGSNTLTINGATFNNIEGGAGDVISVSIGIVADIYVTGCTFSSIVGEFGGPVIHDEGGDMTTTTN